MYLFIFWRKLAKEKCTQHYLFSTKCAILFVIKKRKYIAMHKKTILIILAVFLLAAMLCIAGCQLPNQTDSNLRLAVRGDRELYIEYMQEYKEMGASVNPGSSEKTDIPVQITGTVDTSTLGTYLVKYLVSADGHVATAYRQVHVVDAQQPELKLIGGGHYTMTAGQPYAELGFTAVDNYDGDLAQQVQVTGKVDRYTPGEYTLTYSVTDSNGNQSSANRTVCVEHWDIEEDQMPYIGQPNGKVIYLTFDDGPGKNTPRLLDVLKKYNIKATFFVVKTGYIDTIKRIAAEGHTLAMHTTSHVYKEIYASENAYFKDLQRIQGIIKDLTGQESTILRFPGGSSNKSSKFNPGIMTKLTKLVEEKGYTYFDWNVDSKDAGGAKTAEEVFQNVTQSISKSQKNFSVVLQHDIKSYSIDAVESIITWGLARGYTFLALNENSPVCHHTVRN